MDRLNISRVSDQNGVSLLYIMLEIHHSGREPWNFALLVWTILVVCFPSFQQPLSQHLGAVFVTKNSRSVVALW